jgi:hypothetical protein
MKKVLFLLLILFISSIALSGQNQSIKLDGTDDVLTFPQCEALTGPNFTIEGWVKSSPSNELQVVMMAFQDNINTLNANVTLEIRNAGHLRFNYRAQASTLGGDEIYSKTVIQDGTWHHFAAVKEDNQRLLLYIDGFLESFSCFSLQNITTAPFFEIGRNKYDGAEQFRWLNGGVDDFKIWFKAKTSKDVYEGFKKESGGLEPYLYSNYKFDISSDSIYDCSLYKRHGVIQNIYGIGLSAQFTTNTPNIEDVACFTNFKDGDSDGADSYTNEMLILPNPTNDILRVKFAQATTGNFVIYNTAGQLLLSLNISEKIFEKEISISNLPAGHYILSVTTPYQVLSKKFEKEN